jgi:hypothetical protein
MTEEYLNKLPIDDLFDLLVKSVNELLELHKNQDQLNMILKQKEVELIQSVIVAKRAAEIPLK